MRFFPFMIVTLGALWFWEKAPLAIFLFFSIGVLIAVLAWLPSGAAVNIRRTVDIQNNRADFFERAFGLTREDCRTLQFDGRNFHYEHFERQKIPYESYTAIRYIGSNVTRTNDPSAPHKTAWQHECVDGSPDLRFKNNPKTMTTEEHVIKFEGRDQHLCTVRRYPGEGSAQIKALVDRINICLAGAQITDYEQQFEAFREAHEKRLSIQEEVLSLKSDIDQCAQVIVSADQLVQLGQANSETAAKRTEAASRMAENQLKLDALNLEIEAMKAQEDAAIRLAKAQSEAATHQKIIDQF